MRPALLALLAVLFLAPAAFGQQDTTPPVLLDFTIGPLVFDTSAAPATINWCATVADDLSGVQSVGIVFGTSGATSTVSAISFPAVTQPTSGCSSFQVPQFSLFGTYRIGVSVNDRFQQRRYWHPGISASDVDLCTFADANTCELENVPSLGQSDTDTDGVPDAVDNCPIDPNPTQDDSDLDLIGDVCDPFPNRRDNDLAQCEVDLASALADSDTDGVPDVADNCINEPNGPNDGPNQQMDTDGDLIGNVCDCDFDQDGGCTVGDFNEFAGDFASGNDGGTGTDMDGDGAVGVGDFNYFLPGFADGAPGPSGLAP